MVVEVICGTAIVITVSSLLFAKWAMKFQFYSSPEEIERQRLYDEEMSFKEEQEAKEKIKKEQRCSSLHRPPFSNVKRCGLILGHSGPHQSFNGLTEIWWD